MTAAITHPGTRTGRVIAFARGGLLLTANLMLLGVCFLIYEAALCVQHIDTQLAVLSKSVDGVVQQAGVTFDKINRPCGGGAACGTLASLGKTMTDTGDLIKRADLLTSKESVVVDTNLQPLLDKADATLSNVQQATADLHPLLREATARTHDLQPIETNAAGLIADVDQTARDPKISETIAHLDASAAALAGVSDKSDKIAGNLQTISVDVRDEVHSMTHPRPLVSVANWALKIVHAAGGFF